MPSKPVDNSNAARTARTRTALIETATRLFGTQGYAAVGTEQIVREAKVTRGALYHHFKGKDDLFLAVYEQVEADLMNTIVASLGAGSTDPWKVAIGGSMAYLDACMDPTIQQISVFDAPAVLGVEVQREVADRHASALVTATLQGLMDQGVIRELPLDPLKRMFIGALTEGGIAIAYADNKKRARREVGEVVVALLEGLRTPG